MSLRRSGRRPHDRRPREQRPSERRRVEASILVVAKAPVPGMVKTRLAADLDDHRVAAELAAAALLDTLAAAADAAGPGRRVLALAGDLRDAVRARELRQALRGWRIVAQRGDGLGERLAAAHAAVRGPVVQVGMDTPQVTGALLGEVAAGLAEDDAVLAPAADGGWWALALRDGRRAAPLARVPMSTGTTYADTRLALLATGLSVASAPRLRDVDHLGDVGEVADLAPATAFARAASALTRSAVR